MVSSTISSGVLVTVRELSSSSPHFKNVSFTSSYWKTCLSYGRGYHSPPCHILSLHGFRVLFDCPLDLSALVIFSPIHADSCSTTSSCSSCESSGPESVEEKCKTGRLFDANNLMHAELHYKTVKSLHLFNTSGIDIVLISSPMGMLGLPFLTRKKDFSAKIYATEAASRLGLLMMEDLVKMHNEFRQFYGPGEFVFPQYINWEELEMLPLAMREKILGKDGTDFGGWMSLYSAGDAKECMQKVQTLKFGEEVCYNGALMMKAISSGLEIGACNWTIACPERNVAFLSGSLFASGTAMGFDYHALKRSDIIIYSDFSSWNVMEDVQYEHCSSVPATETVSDHSGDDDKKTASSLLDSDEGLEEMEKLSFVCSCSIDSVKAGGSVLIPIGRPGIVLQLLEQLSSALESSNLKVPIFMISNMAEELLAFSDIIPEWLCKQRQDKLYSGQPLFAHSELLKQKRLHLFPAIYSPKLLSIWQEPCIVFCSHWSLRLGAVVHLLQRWRGDQNSLLVMEEGVDADLALLPFQPMKMKVLQCSLLSGIKLQNIQPLLKKLRPEYALIPEILRWHCGSFGNSFSFGYYAENVTVSIPKLRGSSELDIATDMASQLHWRKLTYGDTNIARLEGDLVLEHGKHRLIAAKEQAFSSPAISVLLWGILDVETLMTTLQKMGINGSVERGRNDAGVENVTIVHIYKPNKALIEVKAKSTAVSTADESLANLISVAVRSILEGI